MPVSLSEVAERAGVSAKTASGALHGGSAAMSPATRERVRRVARELGYVPNLAARGMRQGRMPIVGVVADGLITAPFATDIMRGLNNALEAEGLSSVVASVGARGGVAAAVAGLRQFMPRAVAYAAMYHKAVDLPADVAVGLMINCRDASGRVPALVPDEAAAADALVERFAAAGRRRIAFLTLPGLLAGGLREGGFRSAHARLGLDLDERLIRPATAGRAYTDRARSLVAEGVAAALSGPAPADALLCGNDRVALEAYNALRRHGARIPDDVAVASFDNQVEIAARLDPPLTTAALPHRAMGRIAAEILLGRRAPPDGVEAIPFRLVGRGSG